MKKKESSVSNSKDKFIEQKNQNNLPKLEEYKEDKQITLLLPQKMNRILVNNIEVTKEPNNKRNNLEQLNTKIQRNINNQVIIN